MLTRMPKAVWAFLFAVAACGGGSQKATTADFVVSTRELNREFEIHDRPADLANAAQYVLVGRVAATTLGRAFYGDPNTPPAMVTIQASIEIEQTMKGESEKTGRVVTVEFTVSSEAALSKAREGLAPGTRMLIFADDYSNPNWPAIKELGEPDQFILAPWTDGAWLLDQPGEDSILGVFVDRDELGKEWTELRTSEDLLAAAQI